MGDQSKSWRVVEGNTGEKFYVTKDLDSEKVKENLLAIKLEGIESISVVLAHSYTYFEQELEVGRIAKEIGKKSEG